jgi:tetratricopeptide (TPR) repeat protein
LVAVVEIGVPRIALAQTVPNSSAKKGGQDAAEAPGIADAPTGWHRWAAEARANREKEKVEYERVKALYDRVSPHREIRHRLFQEGDFAFADAELPALFAKISDPLGARQYSAAISALGTFSFDTEPEDLRALTRKWTDERPNSRYAWLVRGVMAIKYGWYWRGSGKAGSVTEQGWAHFAAAIHEAREYLEHAYALEPNDPEISFNLMTVCMAQSGPRRELETYFDRVMKLVPTHESAYGAKFEYLRPAWSGSWPEYKEALAQLDEKLKQQPSPMLLAVKLRALGAMEDEIDGEADAATQARRDTEWSDVTKGMLERWPDDPNIHGHNLVTLTTHKRYDEAWQQFEWLGNRYPMDIEWPLLKFHGNRMHRLIMHANRLNREERLKEFDRIVALDPQHALTYRDIGLCHLNHYEFGQAESSFLRGLEVGGQDPSTLYALATVYEAMGREDEALKWIRQAKPFLIDGAIKGALEEIENRLRNPVGGAFKPIAIEPKPQTNAGKTP